jgi:hypothetical protein
VKRSLRASHCCSRRRRLQCQCPERVASAPCACGWVGSGGLIRSTGALPKMMMIKPQMKSGWGGGLLLGQFLMSAHPTQSHHKAKFATSNYFPSLPMTLSFTRHARRMRVFKVHFHHGAHTLARSPGPGRSRAPEGEEAAIINHPAASSSSHANTPHPPTQTTGRFKHPDSRQQVCGARRLVEGVEGKCMGWEGKLASFVREHTRSLRTSNGVLVCDGTHALSE